MITVAITDSLENELLKKSSWLQRLKPETISVINTQLLIAQKNIIAYISTTENKAKIQAFINQEVTKSLSSFETVFNEDISNITELSYVVTGNLMKNYVSSSLAKDFKGWKSIPDNIESKLLRKDRLLFGNLLSKHKQKLILSTNLGLNEAVNEGFRQNQGIAEISRNIRNRFGITSNDATSLTKTAMFQASNEAQWEAMEFFKDEIIAYYYNGVSDSRQSSYCRLRTGMTSKKREEITRELNGHWLCRSLLGVRTDISEEFEQDKNLVEWNGRKVNKRDGTTETKFKVDEVKKIDLKSTPKQVFDQFDVKYQRQYLGDYRYNLYKNNKVSFESVHNSAKDALIPIRDLKEMLK